MPRFCFCFVEDKWPRYMIPKEILPNLSFLFVHDYTFLTTLQFDNERQNWTNAYVADCLDLSLDRFDQKQRFHESF